MSRTAAILLAAGNSRRMNGATEDKILANLSGKPLFNYSAAAFLESGLIDFYVIVYRDQKQLIQLTAHAPTPALFVKGGSRRQDSVANALNALPPDISHVFIHDCARPLVTPAQIAALHKIVLKENAVILAARVTDTIKQHNPKSLLKTIDRSHLWAAQTPQVFSLPLIQKAYEKIQQQKLVITDDASALEHIKHPVAILENPDPNPKLTTPADLTLLSLLLSHTKSASVPIGN